MPLQSRQEMLEDIGVTIAAIPRQHHLQENIVGKQDAVQISPLHQLDDGFGRFVVTRALDLLIGIEEIHADHVVFDEGTAAGKFSLIAKVIMRRVHVTQNGVTDIRAFLLDYIENPVTQP